MIGVQTLDGRTFDGIVFAERKPLEVDGRQRVFSRTRDLDGPDETAKPDELVHVAITYAADGRIAVYRNGRPYAEPYRPPGRPPRQPSRPDNRRSSSACGTRAAAMPS